MELQQLKEKIYSSKNICIVSHKNPDGDAIGSAVGLAELLNKVNSCARAIVPNEYPIFLNWIENSDNILIWEKEKKATEQRLIEADVIFCVDFNALHRAGEVGNVIAESKAVKVMIDHHLSPENFADYTMSIPAASSTAELVYEFIVQLGLKEKIDKGIAEALYCGIMTDTGSFKYPSTSARTHEITSELIQCGADGGKIHNLVYDSNSINRLKVLGHCLDKMEIIEGKIALFSLPKKVQDEFELINGDTEGIVNYGLSIKEIQVSAFMKVDNDKIKISFRSKGDFDVNTFARIYFSGGGHKNAAGGTSNLSLTDAKAYFKTSILKHFNA